MAPAIKYCFVPVCSNSSRNKPGKTFINVPRNVEVRRKWLAAVGRKLDVCHSTNSLYCCEDHFDLPDDMENSVRYRLMGGRIILKPGLLPHKCIHPEEPDKKPSSEERQCEKNSPMPQKHARCTWKVSQMPDLSKKANGRKPTDMAPADSELLQNNESENLDGHAIPATDLDPSQALPALVVHVAIQTEGVDSTLGIEVSTQTACATESLVDVGTQSECVRVRHVTVQTSKRKGCAEFSSPAPCTTDDSITGPDPTQSNSEDMSNIAMEKAEREIHESSDAADDEMSEVSDSDDLYSPIKEEIRESSDATDDDMNEVSESDDLHRPSEEESSEEEFFVEPISTIELVERMKRLILQNSVRYLGIPEQSLHIIDLLAEQFGSTVKNLSSKDMVLIVLFKMRLNDSYERMSDQFGLSRRTISQIVENLLSDIANLCAQLIFWPDSERILLKLPILFRLRYALVKSIIFAFEIEIEKPSNPEKHALTWSSYKNANTMKYLVSLTPDGLINFVSTGYGGRISDVELTSVSGYLDHLKPGASVMAGQGFKGIESLLQARGCTLERLPSVCNGQVLLRRKRIGALEVASILVERSIKRIRDFAFLSPHTCVPLKLVSLLDHAITIACALINMQTPILPEMGVY